MAGQVNPKAGIMNFESGTKTYFRNDKTKPSSFRNYITGLAVNIPR